MLTGFSMRCRANCNHTNWLGMLSTILGRLWVHGMWKNVLQGFIGHKCSFPVAKPLLMEGSPFWHGGFMLELHNQLLELSHLQLVIFFLMG